VCTGGGGEQMREGEEKGGGTGRQAGKPAGRQAGMRLHVNGCRCKEQLRVFHSVYIWV
jgi:hypothetical protein